MVLKKERLVFKKKGVKPTRFRFKDSVRLGFKNDEVVEVVKFKEAKSKRRIK